MRPFLVLRELLKAIAKGGRGLPLEGTSVPKCPVYGTGVQNIKRVVISPADEL